MSELIAAGTDVTTDPSGTVIKTDKYPYYALVIQAVWTIGDAADAKMYVESTLDDTNWDSEQLIESGTIVNFLTLDMTSAGSVTTKVTSTGKLRVRIDSGSNTTGTIGVKTYIRNLQDTQ